MFAWFDPVFTVTANLTPVATGLYLLTMNKSLAEAILRFRWLGFLLVVATVAAAFNGTRFLSFSNDYRVFFSKDNPQLVAFETLQNTYTKSDNVLIVIAPKDGDVFTPRTLSSVEWVTRESWQMPYSIRVDSISNFQHSYAEGDDLIVEDLVLDAADYSPSRLEEVKKIATNEPLLVKRLISPSGHVTAINVTVQLPAIHPDEEVPEVVDFARQLAEQIRQRDANLDVYLTGVVFMNNAFSENSVNDMKTLVPVMFLIIIVLLVLMLRSIWATLATVVVIMLSIITAMGAAGWLGITVTPPLASAPTMIMTLAVADCVHLLVTFMQGLQQGKNRFDAMKECLRINLQPIFLTSITTAIGFLSMNFSDAPPFRDLGNVVSIGVMAAFVYSIILLPVFMLLFPVKAAIRPPRTVKMMDRIADLVISNRTILLWGMGLFALLMISFIPKNELNDQFVNYFDERVDFRNDTDFTTQNLTGLYSISYSLNANSSGGISEPAYLESMESFANWYAQQEGVIQITTLTDTMKRLNKNMHEDKPDWYRTPQNRELAAQYLLLYEMSLPYGLDLNNQINIDKSATRFDVFVGNLTSNQLMALEDKAQTWLEENAPPGMQVRGASPAVMFSHIGQRNIRSMLIGTTVALILISLLLMFALRSFKIGLLSLVPNLVPAGLAFGLWGITVGQVGLALSIVTGMTLGIVVDDTVHFLSKYLRARREEGMDAANAVRFAFHSVGTALWTTSIVLIAGFMVLSYSPFELNAGMGLLTAITIAFALAADFLLLPPLLMALDKDTEPAGTVQQAAAKI